jgi:hypothetical protein
MAANQLTLAFSVATVSTIYTPAQAAAKLAAVPLYTSTATDLVLGQAFGLTVASDVVSTGGVTYTGEAGGPFVPGETVTDSPGGGTATVAVDESGMLMLFFVEGSASGTFAHGDTITGATSHATATVNNAAADGGPTSTTPGATRVLVLNMTAESGAPLAPPPFPCRPTGPQAPPPAGPPALPYVLEQTTTNRYTLLPVTAPAPAKVAAFYSTNDLDTDGVATTPAIPAGSGAQIVGLTYLDSTGAGPFTVYTKLMGKFPAQVALHAGSVDVAEITECFVEQTGAFDNSVGQITLCALEAALPAIPADATPADFPGLTDAAQLTITRPLIYLPPSYYALAQQQNSAPALAGDFWVKQGSPTVLTTVSQLGVLAATNIVEFAAQPGVQYEVASVSATLVKLTTAYTGLSHPEIAPAAENHHPAQSVSEEADAVVSSAVLVSPSQAAPPDSAHLTTLLAEFTLAQSPAPALTYVDVAGGPFTPGETVTGQKSGGSGVVLYDDPGVDASGTLAFSGPVKSGFVRSETVVGGTSHATATVVTPRTLATNPLPTKLSGLYARTLALVLGAPVVSQPITLV